MQKEQAARREARGPDLEVWGARPTRGVAVGRNTRER